MKMITRRLGMHDRGNSAARSGVPARRARADLYRVAKEVKVPRSTLLAIAIGGMLSLDPSPVSAADPPAAGTPAAQAPAPVKTGKERLSDKASDEQRVDNCNVPPDRRGTKIRPDDCPGKQHQVPTN